MKNNEVRHLINWKDWSDEEIKDVLYLARDVKRNRFKYQGYLGSRSISMIFQKSSTRTRISFEAAMTEMGGHAIFLDWNSSNFKLSKISYEGAYLSRNTSVIMARLKENKDLVELQKSSSVPVINGCDNMYHPCQAMADMLTILEDRGEIKGARLTYIGVHNNVVNSLMSCCAALGVHLTLVCPISESEDIDFDIKERIQKKGLLTETLEKDAAVKDADYVYTDTWINMEFFDNPEYKELKEERLKTMLPYQINSDLMKDYKAKIMHDMPIHDGYEIADEMVFDPRSIIFDQAENRLDAQKAILITLLR